jgi:LPS sulfotransferase NodH
MKILVDLLPSIRRSYTIAFSHRSGSSELCQLLLKNGLGSPGELFQGLTANGDSGAGNDSNAARQVLSIIASHTSNAIFGSKMAHDHRARIDGVLRRTLKGYNTLDDILPDHRWIWLIRRDKIAQAISLCRAEKSGIWSVSSSHAVTGFQRHEEFDYHYILSRVMMLYACDLAWQTYFCDHDISPYTVYYDDFFANLPASLLDLIEHILGLPVACTETVVPDVTATLGVQRDTVSTEWTARFRTYLASVGDLDTNLEFGIAGRTWADFFFNLGWRKDSGTA